MKLHYSILAGLLISLCSGEAIGFPNKNLYAADVPIAASGNHSPRLAHPTGLTVNRKSLGAQALQMPPGYNENGSGKNNHLETPVASPALYRSIASADNGNHAPLLQHPQGLTANRKSLGAQPLSMPRGYRAVTGNDAAPKLEAVTQTKPPSLRNVKQPIILKTERALSAWNPLKLFQRKTAGISAPERVNAWDIDTSKVQVVKPSEHRAPQQHAGALYSNARMPESLRQDRPEKTLTKILRFMHMA